MSEHQYYVDADNIRVMQTPKGSTCGNLQRVVALCATDAGGMDVAVRIAEMLNGSSGYAPAARPAHDGAIIVSELNIKIKADGDGFLICSGQHHVDEPCEFERFTHSAASTVEPVAFRWQGANGVWHLEKEQSESSDYEPLYAAPTTSPEPDQLPDNPVVSKNIASDQSVSSPEPDAVREALRDLYEWWDRDGSVGSASEIFERHRAAVDTALARKDGQSGGTRS